MPCDSLTNESLYRMRVFCVSLAFACFGSVGLASASETKNVLVVVGPSTHKPGTHEVLASGKLVAFCLENSKLPDVQFQAEVSQGWPTDAKSLEKFDVVVFSGDRFPLAELKDQKGMQEMSQMIQRGCGIVCFHYATGLNASQVPDDGHHPLLDWMGGYFATRCKHHQSVAKIFKSATIIPKAKLHPVLRGVKPFTIHDEPYIKNYFGPNGMASNVVALATSMLPPEQPQEEVVAWAIQRKDGGRGMGIVMPHFYENWKVDSLRKMILNGVVWASHVDVPNTGVDVQLPDLAQFEPASVKRP